MRQYTTTNSTYLHQHFICRRKDIIRRWFGREYGSSLWRDFGCCNRLGFLADFISISTKSIGVVKAGNHCLGDFGKLRFDFARFFFVVIFIETGGSFLYYWFFFLFDVSAFHTIQLTTTNKTQYNINKTTHQTKGEKSLTFPSLSLSKGILPEQDGRGQHLSNKAHPFINF